MKFDGYDILVEIVKRREISLGELCEIIPKRFNDYRDFYIVASLYTAEYIDTNLKRHQSDWDNTKNKLVAQEFWNFAYGTDEYSYRAAQRPGDIDNLDDIKIFVTSKADLYFHDQWQKRFDRLATLSIGIFIGIISALASGFFINFFA